MVDAYSQLEEAFVDGVRDLVQATPALDGLLHELEPEQLQQYGQSAARHALASLVWRAAAGDVMTTEQVRLALGVSRQALHQRVEAGNLLGLPSERTTLYPAWQFSNGAVRPMVAQVVRVFREGLAEEYDARLVASWATTPQPELKDVSPSEWLSDGGDPESALSAARRAVDALAR